MHIANPIYDVVFKFMMEDEKVARAFLSAIIQEEVIELDFASQEYTVRSAADRLPPLSTAEDDSYTNFTVCRFDFSARIAVDSGGYKTVLIELQKAKLASDIMRFRRYIGRHYQNPANAFGEGTDRHARQIYCIFLLGYDIGISGAPVIRVNPYIEDVATDKRLNSSNEFIQSLHHRSWIIQIVQLKQCRRTSLEKLLSIFDQDNRTQNHHILNVDEDDFPESFRPIVRRLRMACESENMQIEMEMEDDILIELQERERQVAEKVKIIEAQSKAIEAQSKAIKDKDKAIKQQRKTIKDKDKAIEQQNKLIEELQKKLAGKQN